MHPIVLAAAVEVNTALLSYSSMWNGGDMATLNELRSYRGMPSASATAL
jgi:hypothetical protein